MVSVVLHLLTFCFYDSASINFLFILYAVIKELGSTHQMRDDSVEALTCYKEALELYQQEDTSYHVEIADSLLTLLTQHDIILKVVCFLFSSHGYWWNIFEHGQFH